jgi:drug/metabolite transporter (DMT)-like permease
MRVNKYIQLHAIILLWGFTPVFGKAISLPAFDLVWYRLLLAGIALYAFARFKGVSLKTDGRSLLEIFGIGSIVGLHWFAFYHAIKVSNVSITMAGFSTITLFASLMQPVLLGKRFYWSDLIYGLILAFGLLLIIDVEQVYIAGILWGILAALTSAFFGVYNGRLIRKHEPIKITLIEFAGAFITLNVMMLFAEGRTEFIAFPGWEDWIYLLLLSILCTAVAFTWSIHILKKFTPLTVIITNNLEPIYGIGFSILLFGSSEYMSLQFYIGAAIILISIFTYPFIQRKLYGG